jgi:beta-lactamase superfamily II metal-dependent hydrolase
MRILFAVAGLSILSSCTIEPLGGDECDDHDHGQSFAAVQQAAGLTPGHFGLIQLDVGQGDAAVVIAPSGCAALLDGGPTGAGDAVIKPALAALGVTSLDFAIASHYHADHIGGIDEVDAGTGAVPITAVYDRGGSYSTATYSSYASHFSGRRNTLALGETVTLCGEVALRTVAVNGNGTSTTNENGLSVAVVVSYGAFDALVGGDLTGASPNIESLIAPSVGEVELYKVHHHGSSSSSNSTLLGAMLPTVSVIPVGADNTYGHPAPATVERLLGVGTEIWQTEDPATSTALGHVEVDVAAGGGSYVVRQGAASKAYASKGTAGDVTPPTAPTDLTAIPASTSIDLAWGAATDDVGVTGYRVYRSSDGSSYALHTTTSATSYTDAGLSSGATFWYQVTAIDAAANESAAAGPVSATTTGDTTPCTAAITYLRWNAGKGELTVRATNTAQPTSTMSLSDGSTSLGEMAWQSGNGYYERKVRLASRPPCVTATASCGGTAAQCF